MERLNTATYILRRSLKARNFIEMFPGKIHQTNKNYGYLIKPHIVEDTSFRNMHYYFVTFCKNAGLQKNDKDIEQQEEEEEEVEAKNDEKISETLKPQRQLSTQVDNLRVIWPQQQANVFEIRPSAEFRLKDKELQNELKRIKKKIKEESKVHDLKRVNSFSRSVQPLPQFRMAEDGGLLQSLIQEEIEQTVPAKHSDVFLRRDLQSSRTRKQFENEQLGVLRKEIKYPIQLKEGPLQYRGDEEILEMTQAEFHSQNASNRPRTISSYLFKSKKTQKSLNHDSHMWYPPLSRAKLSLRRYKYLAILKVNKEQDKRYALRKNLNALKICFSVDLKEQGDIDSFSNNLISHLPRVRKVSYSQQGKTFLAFHERISLHLHSFSSSLLKSVDITYELQRDRGLSSQYEKARKAVLHMLQHFQRLRKFSLCFQNKDGNAKNIKMQRLILFLWNKVQKLVRRNLTQMQIKFQLLEMKEVSFQPVELDRKVNNFQISFYKELKQDRPWFFIPRNFFQDRFYQLQVVSYVYSHKLACQYQQYYEWPRYCPLLQILQLKWESLNFEGEEEYLCKMLKEIGRKTEIADISLEIILPHVKKEKKFHGKHCIQRLLAVIANNISTMRRFQLQVENFFRPNHDHVESSFIGLLIQRNQSLNEISLSYAMLDESKLILILLDFFSTRKFRDIKLQCCALQNCTLTEFEMTWYSKFLATFDSLESISFPTLTIYTNKQWKDYIIKLILLTKIKKLEFGIIDENVSNEIFISGYCQLIRIPSLTSLKLNVNNYKIKKNDKEFPNSKIYAALEHNKNLANIILYNSKMNKLMCYIRDDIPIL